MARWRGSAPASIAWIKDWAGRSRCRPPTPSAATRGPDPWKHFLITPTGVPRPPELRSRPSRPPSADGAPAPPTRSAAQPRTTRSRPGTSRRGDPSDAYVVTPTGPSHPAQLTGGRAPHSPAPTPHRPTTCPPHKLALCTIRTSRFSNSLVTTELMHRCDDHGRLHVGWQRQRQPRAGATWRSTLSTTCAL